MTNYILPFLISFLITVVLILAIIPVSKKIKWTQRKSQRHIHNKGVKRIGGIAMVLAFNMTLLWVPRQVITPEVYSIMISSVILMIIGLIDDIKEIYWKVQLFFQLIAAIFIFIVGVRVYYITNPLNGGIIMMDTGFMVVVSLILVVFWIILVMNALNWLDGIDGLSGSISMITALTIFFLSLKAEVNQPHTAIIAAVFLGTVIGFLIFNFNPSRILAGTSGAMFMGFILATLAILSGTKIATALLVMFIPIMDLLWVVGERWKKGSPIFQPDRTHLHHKLLDLGWSQRKITNSYIIATVAIAIVALNTRFIGKSITLILAMIIMVAIFIFLDRRIGRSKEKV